MYIYIYTYVYIHVTVPRAAPWAMRLSTQDVGHDFPEVHLAVHVDLGVRWHGSYGHGNGEFDP